MAGKRGILFTLGKVIWRGTDKVVGGRFPWLSSTFRPSFSIGSVTCDVRGLVGPSSFECIMAAMCRPRCKTSLIASR